MADVVSSVDSSGNAVGRGQTWPNYQVMELGMQMRQDTWFVCKEVHKKKCYNEEATTSGYEDHGQLCRKCLDKAAVITDIENKNGDFSNPWGLLQSMEALHRMMMDRTIGSFFIPAASLSTCDIISVIFWVPVYDRVIIPIVRKFTGREKGFIELQRMGIGLFILVLCMVSAALVEMKRLALAQALGLVDENVPIPLSITWQIPQYFLFGAAEVFTFIGQLEFFYEQSPDGMRSLFAALSLLTTSMGSYLSSFILTVVTSRSTETRMRMLAKGWDLGVGEDLEAFGHLIDNWTCNYSKRIGIV
ncbi:protein NRT1/ PTR FAMILY 8.3-like [Camellia sinensis]|uniref:protein NRT1/ PTR FAMILY 8.3-like n=1 Tax=Camellia sinensis TaxID=4442 RepID=UPI001035908A|nr:protein NRT1/ PTR FAMILY 8.3-like [Camellia sinensis]